MVSQLDVEDVQAQEGWVAQQDPESTQMCAGAVLLKNLQKTVRCWVSSGEKG